MTVDSVPLSGLSLWAIPSRRLAGAKLDKAEQAAAAQERAQERFAVAQGKVGARGKLVWLLFGTLSQPTVLGPSKLSDPLH